MDKLDGEKVKRDSYNSDWLACASDVDKPKGMIDWLFAYSIATGKI